MTQLFIFFHLSEEKAIIKKLNKEDVLKSKKGRIAPNNQQFKEHQLSNG